MSAGGWTVIMRKEVNSKYQVDFQLPLAKYKVGFGDLSADHFLGLNNIHILTKYKDRLLMAILNETQYKYSGFKVLGEYDHYKLILRDEIDKLIDGSSFLQLNNTYFSTIDVDYDLAANSNCSGGWNGGNAFFIY
jgi:ficolin